MIPAWMIQEEYEKVCESNQELRDTIEELDEQLEEKDSRIAELEETLDAKQSQIELQTQDHLALIERQTELDAKIPQMMSALRTVRDLADEFSNYAEAFNYVPCCKVTRYLSDIQNAVSRGLYATSN